jgi:hypothetical protein
VDLAENIISQNLTGDKNKGQNRRFTAKMQAFADEWLTGDQSGKKYNLGAACKVAGYGDANNPHIRTIGYKVMRHPLVKEYIDRRMNEMSMSSAEVLMRFTDIARAPLGNVVTKNMHGHLDIDVDKVLENSQYIKSFSFDSNGKPKIDFMDPQAALRDIARARGMLKDGLEVSGPGGGSVPIAMSVQFVNPDGSTYNPTPNAQQAKLEAGEDFDDIEEGEFEDVDTSGGTPEG